MCEFYSRYLEKYIIMLEKYYWSIILKKDACRNSKSTKIYIESELKSKQLKIEVIREALALKYR